MSEKVVYLMRGLPSCGKTHTARWLAGETGLVCETDEYFYTHVGDDPNHYDFSMELMPEARRWNLERFRKAVDAGVSPVVVDRGNGRSEQTRVYARYAVDQGYRVELREPQSPWWQEIRVLLKYKKYTWPVLEAWAVRLTRMNDATHRTTKASILNRMRKWDHKLTVESILSFEPVGKM